MRFILAILGVGLLGAFLGVLLYHVPRADLIIVCGITFAMCAFDFLQSVKADEQH
jgi:hypothetical protein